MAQRTRLFFCIGVFLAGIAAIGIIYHLQLNGPPIRSDGMGYYLYLPATFIYHDLSLQKIAVAQFSGTIPDWTGAAIYRNTQNYLIKYPMGEAVLLAPFFGIAYILSLITHAPPDGFSYIFQYAAAVSGIWYMTAGIYVLWNFLRKWFRTQTILITLFGIVFGTNLFHYGSYDAVFSHTYSFFLFCLLLSAVERLYRMPSVRRFITVGLISGLVVITRPMNVLFLIFLGLYGVTSMSDLTARIRFLRHHITAYLLMGVMFMLVITPQLIYWKMVTGHMIAYAYTEPFDLAKPALIYVLFGINKGLFFWSPILLMAIPGIWMLKRRVPEVFVPVCIYLFLVIYIIASWNNGWCGASFGSRFLVDALPVFAIAICACLENIRTPRARRMVALYVCGCVLLSMFLMIQYWIGTLPMDDVTWHTFISVMRIPFGR